MRLRAGFFAFLLSAGSAHAQDAALRLEPQSDGRTDPSDIRVVEADLNAQGPIWWQQTVRRIGANYIRFHIETENATEVTDTILLVEGRGGVSLSYDLSGIGGKEFWSGLVPGGLAVLSIRGGARPVGLELRIPEIVFQAETGKLSSVWGDRDETVHINDPSVPASVRELSSPIAKLVFQSGGAPRTCTGFLVDEATLLTNEHCINSEESCATLVALFGYQFDADDSLNFGKQYTCAGFDSSKVNFELDASLVSLHGAPGAEWGVVNLGMAGADIGAPLALIQHPGGEPKQVSFIQCSALAQPVDGRGTGTDFTHTCDSAGGSSGAPVFDAGGHLVGLHHYGFAEAQVQEWTENRAVRLERIRNWVATFAP
jgi:V8-like Glu-specific endopeptidase